MTWRPSTTTSPPLPSSSRSLSPTIARRSRGIGKDSSVNYPEDRRNSRRRTTVRSAQATFTAAYNLIGGTEGRPAEQGRCRACSNSASVLLCTLSPCRRFSVSPVLRFFGSPRSSGPPLAALGSSENNRANRATPPRTKSCLAGNIECIDKRLTFFYSGSVKISVFHWDDGNIDHVAAHGVAQWEVEQVFRRHPKVRRAREGRYQAAGATEGGRFLVVHFRYLGSGVVRVITARDMTRKERRRHART